MRPCEMGTPISISLEGRVYPLLEGVFWVQTQTHLSPSLPAAFRSHQPDSAISSSTPSAVSLGPE